MSGRTFRRWDLSQMRQHQFTMLCTFTLIFTGVPLRYAGSKTVQSTVGLLQAATLSGVLHRIAAAGLLISCIWHAVYLARRWRRKTFRWSMMPALSDLTDALETVKWLLGWRPSEPTYDRYNFIEKFEYLAIVWGSFVMLLTGLILWFPVRAAGMVTGVGIEVAKTVHGYEAVLAALAILLWHMYHAHLRADVFPMNRLWLTGTLTEEEMRHHHGRELARIEAEERQAAEAAAAARLAAERAAAQRQAGEGGPTDA